MLGAAMVGGELGCYVYSTDLDREVSSVLGVQAAIGVPALVQWSWEGLVGTLA